MTLRHVKGYVDFKDEMGEVCGMHVTHDNFLPNFSDKT